MTLITHDRLMALARINRWGGWVKWDYSVLTHEVVGAARLKAEGLPWKPFLLHDHEESEFGDVIAPVKAVIPVVSEYHTRVADFNTRLTLETGVVPDGGDMDVDMAHAEHLTVAVRGDQKFDSRPVTSRVRALAQDIAWIGEQRVSHTETVHMWFKLWNA